MRISCDNEPN